MRCWFHAELVTTCYRDKGAKKAFPLRMVGKKIAPIVGRSSSYLLARTTRVHLVQGGAFTMDVPTYDDATETGGLYYPSLLTVQRVVIQLPTAVWRTSVGC